MTDKELHDYIVSELKLTTVGYINNKWKTPPAGTHWANAMNALEQFSFLQPAPPSVTQYPLPPAPGPWVLKWHDDFDSLDRNKWSLGYWGAVSNGDSWNDPEQECYTEANVSVQNGLLSLTARREDHYANGKTYPYTSGIVTTTGQKYRNIPLHYSFNKGYIEASIKVPKGKGLWTGFWLMRADPTFSSPYQPEIDISEVLCGDPYNSYGSVHFASGTNRTQTVSNEQDLSASFHTYGLLWESGHLAWYLDGQQKAAYDGSDVPEVAMYILLNLAVGASGSWGGAPDSSTLFPASMLVDWVRVWQHQ